VGGKGDLKELFSKGQSVGLISLPPTSIKGRRQTCKKRKTKGSMRRRSGLSEARLVAFV